jgi:hypothetical protein
LSIDRGWGSFVQSAREPDAGFSAIEKVRVRDRVDRAAAAVLPSIEIDPYHARATAGSPADMDEAAAASLLLADRVTVDEQGENWAGSGGAF